MINRRRLLLQLPCGVVWPSVVIAADPPKVIGLLNAYVPADVRRSIDQFERALEDRGYVKGIHYVTIERMAEGRNERLRPMAEELVRSKVDLIMAAPSNAVAEAQRATSTIPIVFVAVSDPVREGFADTLARPGHNLTGLSNNAGDLGPKRLEFLKQMVPGLARLAILATPQTPTYPAATERLRAFAESLGWQTAVFEAPLPLELAAVFKRIVAFSPHALYVAGDAYLWGARRQLADLALRSGLPTTFPFVEHVEAGGLMSYGADRQDWMRQSAVYVDKIFKGARPGELPIEQPSKIDLVINRATADALQLRIPRALLLQAGRIIE
jgi:putative ABC transport system substrate-binding protein